jgi:hypothetical protein
MWTAFPSSDYYAPSATSPLTVFPLRALEFRWGFPYLLPTPLRIPGEASRVHSVRLKQDGLGGVFLTAPSALCGFPVVVWGKQVRPYRLSFIPHVRISSAPTSAPTTVSELTG